jgi:hypothetical protein
VKCTYDEQKINPAKLTEFLEDSYTIPFWEVYISATEPLFYCLMAVDTLTEIDDLVRSLRRAEFIISARPLIGIFHDYFEGPRSRKLKEMLLEESFIDEIPKMLPLSES